MFENMLQQTHTHTHEHTLILERSQICEQNEKDSV